MPNTNDRTTKDRRSVRRWTSEERRKGGDRRDGAYREFARQLPNRYLEMAGTPRERVLYLVSEYCRGCDESLQIDLAQALLPILQTVVTFDGGEVTEEHLLACEAAVAKCVKQNELETGRWDTACQEETEETE